MFAWPIRPGPQGRRIGQSHPYPLARAWAQGGAGQGALSEQRKGLSTRSPFKCHLLRETFLDHPFFTQVVLKLRLTLERPEGFVRHRISDSVKSDEWGGVLRICVSNNSKADLHPLRDSALPHYPGLSLSRHLSLSLK